MSYVRDDRQSELYRRNCLSHELHNRSFYDYTTASSQPHRKKCAPAREMRKKREDRRNAIRKNGITANCT